MKRIFTMREFGELTSGVVSGDLSPGEPGHIEDHNLIANKLNYSPVMTVGMVEKISETAWLRYEVSGRTQEWSAQKVQDELFDDSYHDGFILQYPGQTAHKSEAECPVGTLIQLSGNPAYTLHHLSNLSHIDLMLESLFESIMFLTENVLPTLVDTIDIHIDESGTPSPQEIFPIQGALGIQYFSESLYTYLGGESVSDPLPADDRSFSSNKGRDARIWVLKTPE